MKEINELKKYMNLMNETNAELESIESEIDNDPENEALDEKWNEVYEENFEYTEKCIDIISNLLNIDTKTARKMINMYNNEIENLIKRVA